jgi:hypothetical protein
VEIFPLAHMLEDLLHESSESGIEVCLAESSRDVGEDLTAVQNEYKQRFQRAVGAVREIRGEPFFDGTWGDPGYPLDLACERVACWATNLGTIFVALAWREETLLLVGGARPNPVEQGGITLLPPAS